MSDDDVRTRADERRRLLAELELERNQFIRNVETCRIRDIERPFIGDWSVKDIVGHVASWEAEVVTALRELRAGRRPELYDFNRSRLDAWNQEHVERKRSLGFFSVLEQLKDGRHRLLEELAHIPDEDLVDDGSRYRKLVQAVIDHDREHWHAIAARLAGMEGARRTGAQSIIEEATS
ncbi:MAG: maleylpyruvate isomerase N-terminal domain-containing protein [Dehalococcoidia bacterium]|nr:maleylpyruvate isomerase N-terminal domain-containing protein [Dehalococcoidia bacterium]